MRYSTFDVIALRGPDAAAFAQAQLASDVASLADGHWQWTAYLTAQGRTIALMLLARHAADALDLLVPAARGAELAARLQRFVFRSRVRIAADPERVLHARGDTPAALDSAIAGSSDAFSLRLPGGFVLDATVLDAANAHRDETAFRAWLVDAGIPMLAGAAVEAQTPHALGLDALGAISTKKGCYPGQEIVARTHFLGRNKRHLCRFERSGGGLPVPGDVIEGDAGAAAEVVLALNRAEGSVGGLAVAHEQALTGNAAFRMGGSAVSLARIR